MKDKFKVSEFFNNDIKVTYCIETDTILKAKSLMLLNDFSQIPVLNKSGKISGSVSWKSIGKNESLGVNSTNILDYIENAVIINDTDDFLKFIKLVAKKDYILVKNNQNELQGIVTTYDMTMRFKDFIIPYLHLGIIEDCIRTLILKYDIHTKKNIEELTFGEYQRLLDSVENWDKIQLTQIDKSVFLEKLDEIRKLRNNIAHYKPKGLTPKENFAILSFATMMQKICM